MTSKFRRRTPGIAPWCPRHIIPQLIFFSSFQNFSNYSFDVSSIRSNYKIFPLEQIPSIKITPWITRPIVSIVSSIEILKNLYIEKQLKIKVKIITFVTNNENTISFFIITILADFSYEFYEDRSFRAQRTKKKKKKRVDELARMKGKKRWKKGRGFARVSCDLSGESVPLRSKPPIRGKGKREPRKWPIYTTRCACHWQWKTFMETCFTFYEWSHRLLNPFGESTGGKNDGLWMA